MSLASSEASLTLCSGTLRTSIGAGTGDLSLSSCDDGAELVAGHGVGDVYQGGDDGAGAAVLEEAQGGVDLGAHAAARELTLRGLRAHLGGGDPAERPLVRRAEIDHHVGDVGRDDEGVGLEVPS